MLFLISSFSLDMSRAKSNICVFLVVVVGKTDRLLHGIGELWSYMTFGRSRFDKKLDHFVSFYIGSIKSRMALLTCRTASLKTIAFGATLARQMWGQIF